MVYTLNHRWRCGPRSFHLVCRNGDAIGDGLCENAREMHAVLHRKKKKNNVRTYPRLHPDFCTEFCTGSATD